MCAVPRPHCCSSERRRLLSYLSLGRFASGKKGKQRKGSTGNVEEQICHENTLTSGLASQSCIVWTSCHQALYKYHMKHNCVVGTFTTQYATLWTYYYRQLLHVQLQVCRCLTKMPLVCTFYRLSHLHRALLAMK